MRISDWSSDVCSSDLARPVRGAAGACRGTDACRGGGGDGGTGLSRYRARRRRCPRARLPGAGGLLRGALRNDRGPAGGGAGGARSEEHTSELQSLMRISYAVFCLKKKKNQQLNT